MNLKLKADELRLKTFDAIYKAGGGHFGGSLSAIEIMTVLYYDTMNIDAKNYLDDSRDRFILCKGHAGPPLYVILADLGIIAEDRIQELDKNGGSLPKHVDRLKVDGIEYSSGPLGQGMSVASGMALFLKADQPNSQVYALLGDGECDEGQVWEAAMFAAQYKLDNLTAIVDYNKCQIDGSVSQVMELEPFTDKWCAFGWNVIECDGHDTDQLKSALAQAKAFKGRPSVIIAHTHKGRGVSFMEDNYLWHSGSITEEQYNMGIEDLSRRTNR